MFKQVYNTRLKVKWIDLNDNFEEYDDDIFEVYNI